MYRLLDIPHFFFVDIFEQKTNLVDSFNITVMDEKREHIITVAEKLFVRFGFHKTTVDEIAKAAAMGKATLYYYFKSKEEIFAAVIHKDTGVVLQKLTEAVNSSSTPQEKLRNYMVTRTKMIEELSNHYEVILKTEYADIYPLAEQERKQFYRQEVAMITGILRDGVAQHVFTVNDVESTAKMFIAILRGMEDRWFFSGNEALDMERELNLLLHILLKGVESRYFLKGQTA